MEETESRIQEEQGKSKKAQGIREAKSVLISNIQYGSRTARMQQKANHRSSYITLKITETRINARSNCR